MPADSRRVYTPDNARSNGHRHCSAAQRLAPDRQASQILCTPSQTTQNSTPKIEPRLLPSLWWFSVDSLSNFTGPGMDNRRTTIVINKKFQYQFALLVAAMAVLFLNGFLIVRILFPGEPPLDLPTPTIIGIAAVELILIACIWYWSIKASHRIAGPMYVITREIDKLGGGDMTARVNIREKDMFQPEAERMNVSIAALQAKIITVKALAEKLQQAQASGGNTGDIVSEIVSELSDFNTAN